MNDKNDKNDTPIVPLQGTERESGQTDFLETDALFRIRKFFRKKEDTPMDRGEARAWEHKGNRAAVMATSGRDWNLLAWFYAQPDGTEAAKFRRKGMAQLLNNWNAEVERAGAAARMAGVSLGAQISEKKEKGPEGWRELLLAEDPELHLPEVWAEVPENMRKWAWELSRVKTKEGTNDEQE